MNDGGPQGGPPGCPHSGPHGGPPCGPHDSPMCDVIAAQCGGPLRPRRPKDDPLCPPSLAPRQFGCPASSSVAVSSLLSSDTASISDFMLSMIVRGVSIVVDCTSLSTRSACCCCVALIRFTPGSLCLFILTETCGVINILRRIKVQLMLTGASLLVDCVCADRGEWDGFYSTWAARCDVSATLLR